MPLRRQRRLHISQVTLKLFLLLFLLQKLSLKVSQLFFILNAKLLEMVDFLA
jgi:hypothetical protein